MRVSFVICLNSNITIFAFKEKRKLKIEDDINVVIEFSCLFGHPLS